MPHSTSTMWTVFQKTYKACFTTVNYIHKFKLIQAGANICALKKRGGVEDETCEQLHGAQSSLSACSQMLNQSTNYQHFIKHKCLLMCCQKLRTWSYPRPVCTVPLHFHNIHLCLGLLRTTHDIQSMTSSAAYTKI
jgi:hypothetical protein